MKRASGQIARRLAFGALLALPFAAAADPALGPLYFDYQVRLPPAPLNARDAQATLDARALAVIATVACGDEFAFAQDGVSQDAGEDSTARVLAKLEWGAGHPGVTRQARAPGLCRFSRTLRWFDFNNADVCTLLRDKASCTDDDTKAAQAKVESAADALWADVVAGRLDGLKDKVLAPTLPPNARSCLGGAAAGGTVADRSILAWRLLDPFPGAPGIATGRLGAVQLDIAISQDCLLRQVAQSLTSFKIPTKDGKQQVAGTDGTPCHAFGTLYGDWDMAERNLIRIAYLIKGDGLAADGAVLHDAYGALRDHLLTLDRGPEGDSHNAVFGCGNSAGHTGSAEDRAADRSDSGQSRDEALGDLGWFLLFLLLLLAILFAVAVALAALGAGIVAALAAAAVVVAVVVAAQIPETENHLLGINTTKYLNNQLILQDLGNDLTLTAPYIEDQIALKAWLLARLQTYVQQDFIEYNSRPYQRHSIESIRNLFDFAGDPGRPNQPDADLRNAAQLVLDYTSAKFAVGSNQGRRMVPYRRHRSDLAKAVDVDADGWNGHFDLISSADHQVGLGLLYSGQTQQLPLGQASRSFAAEVINAATSTYVPESTILDLAVAKDVPIYQRVHHATEEIYSGGTGFLVSAGGLSTGLAYPVTGIPAIDGHVDDWGSGVPTTLFLTGDAAPGLGDLVPPPGAAGPPSFDQKIYQLQQALAGPGVAPPDGPVVPYGLSVNGIYAAWLNGLQPAARIRSTLGEFIRIKGRYHVDTATNDDGTPQREPTYDNNLCVWDGFACGTNLELGPMATDCAAVVGPTPWTFIDSRRCGGRAAAPRTFIAVFRKDCPPSQDCSNYGFFEVIDADRFAALHPPAAGQDPFDAFRARIAADNAALGSMPAGPGMVSDYHSVRGQKLEISCWGHDSGGDDWGVFKVDGVATHGLGDWPFAGGEWSGAGSLLRPEVRTPMIAAGDGLVTITSPRLTAFADATRPRVLTLDFRNRDHPLAAAER